MNKKNKNYLYSILGTPKQLLGKHVGKKTEVINGDIYCNSCGRFLGAICDPFIDRICKNCYSQRKKSPLKVGKGWKKIFKIR